MGVEGISRQLVWTKHAIERATRTPVQLFRPPYGAHDRAVDETARTLGLLEVLWSVDSRDSEGAPASRVVFVTYLSSLRSIEIEREVRGSPRPVDPPYRASAAYADGVLTLTLDRSLIDDAGSFRFSLVTADLVGPGEPEGKGAEGRIEALDVAPDGLVAGKQLAYRLSHAPPIHLEAADPVSSPTGFRPGQKVVVAVVVRRSDTFGVVRTGSVRCTAAAGGKALPTTGSFAGGRAQCLFAVPTGSRSGRVRGTIAVLALGAAVRLPFAYPSR